MSTNSILEQIKNNLEWLDIDTKDKTWKNIIKELDKEEKQQAMAIETTLLIKLYLQKYFNIKEMEETKENGK